MPGNQPGNSGDVELKIGYMVKRSQGKSAIGAVNFKKRVFVLTPSRLQYFDGNLDVSSIIIIITILSIILSTNIIICTAVGFKTTPLNEGTIIIIPSQ